MKTILRIASVLAQCAIMICLPLKNSIGGRCFTGGEPFKTINATSAPSEVCLRDDISMVKSIGIHSRGDDSDMIESSVTFYRLYYVKDWHDCNPISDHMGTFLVLNIEESGSIKAENYACRTRCDISLNRDRGTIELTSTNLNHYSITGTTIASGWFNLKLEVQLLSTCESISVTCGQKTLEFKACFRQHRKCINYFHGSILPEIMIEGICANLEVIILIFFICLNTILAIIITNTYVVYALIPLIYPFYKLYGTIYNKCLKKCKNCKLAIHPFTICPTKCICGMVYNSTEALYLHRQCNNCTGYKALTHARIACKKKIPNAIMAIFTTILIFSFLTPVSAECYNLSDLPQDYVNMVNYIGMRSLLGYIIASLALLVAIVILLQNKLAEQALRLYYVNCAFCGMIHHKRNLILEQGFTNQCLTCVCHDKNIHKATKKCTIKYKWHITNNIRWLVFISILIIMPASIYPTQCLRSEEITNLEEASTCISVYQNITQKKQYHELIKSMSEQLSSDEVSILLPQVVPSYINLIHEIENENDLHTAIVKEIILANLYPEIVKKYYSAAGPDTVKWRTILLNAGLHICSEHVVKMICRCALLQQECQSVTSDDGNQIETYYKSHKEEFYEDMASIFKVIYTAFPGLTKFLLVKSMSNRALQDAVPVLGKLKYYTRNNNHLNGIVTFAEHIISKNVTSESRTINFEVRKLTGQQFTDKNIGSSGITTCQTPKLVTCTGKRLRSLQKEYIACSNNGVKMYLKEDKIYCRVGADLCVGDKYCLISFTPITDKENVDKLICYATEFRDQSNGMLKSSQSIRVKKLGSCTLKDQSVNVAMSSENLLYKYDTIYHKKTPLVDEYCLSKKCTSDHYPYSNENLKNCLWTITNHKFQSQLHIDHQDIESFISGIKLSLHNDLITHNYKPTQNMPHIIPNYKSIFVSGSDNGNTITDAYILFNIPLTTGLSQGFSVNTKANKGLFDLVVYIKRATIKAEYVFEYETGPTIGINAVHSEKCTGFCPREIPHTTNWLTFTKEHTSSWGCEEWGCLAINTGCVYGSCQDIIKPEGKVYKKIGSETIDAEICITDSSETFCTEITSYNPILGEKVQIEIVSQDTSLLPSNIFQRNNNIYKGDINPKGTFAKKCGSVQKVQDQIYGSGEPRFDYICHAASRKDVVVRKCYDNAYISCSTLEPIQNMDLIKDNSKWYLRQGTGLYGSVKVKLLLGDLNYKQDDTTTTRITAKAVCGGCTDCFDDVSCRVDVTSNNIASCPVESTCSAYINRLSLVEGSQQLHLKFKCKMEAIAFSICGIKVEIRSEIVKSHKILDLASLSQTSYIREYDKKCGTWLCRVYNEGLEGIIGPIWKEFNIWLKYGTVVVILIFSAILIVKVINPLIKLIINTLKHNEQMYLLESKQK
ncbi:M polyprotein [Shamonda virus]|nr:M polyprotein [Shamonda virus]